MYLEMKLHVGRRWFISFWIYRCYRRISLWNCRIS